MWVPAWHAVSVRSEHDGGPVGVGVSGWWLYWGWVVSEDLGLESEGLEELEGVLVGPGCSVGKELVDVPQ